MPQLFLVQGDQLGSKAYRNRGVDRVAAAQAVFCGNFTGKISKVFVKVN